MRKWLIVLVLLMGSLQMFAGEEKNDSGENRELVYKVDIKDEIGPSIWRLVKRSFDRATDENADVILVHMNIPHRTLRESDYLPCVTDFPIRTGTMESLQKWYFRISGYSP